MFEKQPCSYMCGLLAKSTWNQHSQITGGITNKNQSLSEFLLLFLPFMNVRERLSNDEQAVSKLSCFPTVLMFKCSFRRYSSNSSQDGIYGRQCIMCSQNKEGIQRSCSTRGIKYSFLLDLMELESTV